MCCILSKHDRYLSLSKAENYSSLVSTFEKKKVFGSFHSKAPYENHKKLLTFRKKTASSQFARRVDWFYCLFYHRNECMCKMNTVIHIHSNRLQYQNHHRQSSCVAHLNHLIHCAMILTYEKNEQINHFSYTIIIRSFVKNMMLSIKENNQFQIKICSAWLQWTIHTKISMNSENV